MNPISPGDVLHPEPTAPQSREAEMALLGAMILDNQVIGEVVELVTGREMFYFPAHQTVFEAILRLHLEGKPIDLVVLRDDLAKDRRLEAVGGADYLMALTEGVPSAAHAVTYAGSVRDLFRRRRAIEAGTRFVQALSRGDLNGEALVLESALADLKETINAGATMKARPIGDLWQEAQRPVERIPTGIGPLDALIGGLGIGWLLILAAYTGQGKTRLLLAIARYLAHVGYAILFFSGELSGIESARILGEGCILWPFFITDEVMTIGKIEDEVAAFKGAHTKGAVFLDYISLFAAGDGTAKPHEVGKVAHGLRAIAQKHQVPIVAAAQLNRASQEGAPPRLANLADSAGIERAADHAVLLQLEGSIITATLAKSRWGSSGAEAKIKADFAGLSFTEVTSEEALDERLSKLQKTVEDFIVANGPTNKRAVCQNLKVNGRHPSVFDLGLVASRSKRIELDPASETIRPRTGAGS